MKTILIIDDEMDLCALLKKALLKENFEVDCAFTLAEAGQKMLGEPEIVLLDNNLPDGSGIEYIHRHPGNFSNSFVIVISADARPETRKRAAKEGVRGFIQKPFTLKKVRELIHELD